MAFPAFSTSQSFTASKALKLHILGAYISSLDYLIPILLPTFSFTEWHYVEVFEVWKDFFVLKISLFPYNLILWQTKCNMVNIKYNTEMRISIWNKNALYDLRLDVHIIIGMFHYCSMSLNCTNCCLRIAWFLLTADSKFRDNARMLNLWDEFTFWSLHICVFNLLSFVFFWKMTMWLSRHNQERNL